MFQFHVQLFIPQSGANLDLKVRWRKVDFIKKTNKHPGPTTKLSAALTTMIEQSL